MEVNHEKLPPHTKRLSGAIGAYLLSERRLQLLRYGLHPFLGLLTIYRKKLIDLFTSFSDADANDDGCRL